MSPGVAAEEIDRGEQEERLQRSESRPARAARYSESPVIAGVMSAPARERPAK
jgi:hypothetical protein